ncbi:ADP-L-glycero-D-manno-heptose-6-epimerase [Alkalidesulfovibrio alkalitolerans DSM 16529]|uniref:ADP-L-glycero-D-manno-heptose-6-epimerase n=1 Tax=Alkalidesulfovibrio alkalitolerans DSM 16529 TaxID=1121439 RepID=S7ULB9_9BACT|nr:ADP-glyceromanno-heptose 6-epimerase [Alkalidesulfovibrio alkalitolerans]EPR34659.1 ADP-L-glycero-D-manno-heptose-6-epimerase [Alkalidesulfovibrio alkalitolerans DSM 16529]
MYVVTGGAGFIGSAFVWKLNQMGVSRIVVVDELGHDEKWKNLVRLRYEEYVHKDEFLKTVEAGRDPWGVRAVVHMGACSSTTETDADYLMRNNLRYSQILAKFCVEKRARFVNASSAATYGDGTLGFSDDTETMLRLKPLNMYGYSKQLFDLWAHSTGLLDHLASLKFFNVYGPNEYHKGDMMSVICKAHKQIGETGRLRLFKSYRPDYGPGEQKRDFIYVKDCLEVMWWLLENPRVNGVFNVGTGKARSWNDLARAVFAAMGREPDIEYIEMPEAIRDKYQYFTEAPMEKLRRAGYDREFTSLEDGARDYVQNYLEKPEQHFDSLG